MKKQEILRKIKLFLFDMDGTLYIGDRLFDFTPRLLDTIKRNGGRYMFLTNNSSKSVNDYIKKLGGMGIKADCDDFLTSSQATAYLLRRDYPGKTLYVCGTRSLEEELEKEGFSLTCDTSRAECIVMGYDTELTYQKLYDVSYMLSTRDIPYIATNPDYVCPTEFGSVPDCGSICDMIFNATGKRPEVIGKPQPLMPLLAMERAGCKPRETAVIGDRIYTDVKSGINAGAVSVLVMSGETTPEILAGSDIKPDIVLSSCADFLNYVPSEAE